MRGLPKKYAKMGFKKGWRAYRASKRGRSNPRKTKSVKKVARRKRYRRAIRRRIRRPKTIPLAPIIGYFGPLLAGRYGGTGIIDHIKAGDFGNAAKDVCALTTGYDPVAGTWDFGRASALHGLLIGLVIHKGVNMLGGNRVFARMPSPLNKLRI